MICLRAALPNFRSAHAFATRQLIGAPQKTHGRANFVQVLYEISVVFGESDGKPNGPFCKLLQNSLRTSHIFQVFLATPAERGEPRIFKSLPRRVPNSPIIRNQWLTWHGSNFSGDLPTKKKVAGRVAALSDDKQKFIALPDYQNLGNPASSGSEVLS